MILQKELKKGLTIYFLENNKVKTDIITDVKEFADRNDNFTIQISLVESKCRSEREVYSSKEEAKIELTSRLNRSIENLESTIADANKDIEQLTLYLKQI